MLVDRDHKNARSQTPAQRRERFIYRVLWAFHNPMRNF